MESATSRREGWSDVVGRPADATADHLHHTDFRVDGGRRAMAALLDLPQPPDAVFAANNLTGVGALQVLLERGLAPPDFGLAVFGDLPFALPWSGGHRLGALPSRHLGETAARLLLERINGDDQPARTIMLRATLAAP